MINYDALRQSFLNQVDEQLQAFKERDAEIQALQEELATRREKLQEESERIAAERARHDHEKEAMWNIEPATDDVIELNVQGESMSTLRGTLCQVPDSRLAFLFSGQWEDKLQKDSQGRYFLNFVPSCFRKVLEFLVTKQLAGNDPAPAVKVPPEIAPSFEILVQHLGLEDAFFGGPKFSRTLKSATVRLSDDALVARNDSVGEGYVIGEYAYQNELVQFTLLIESLDREFARMFIGVMADGNTLNSDNSFQGNAGAFGWAGVGQVWVAGKSEQGLGDYPMEFLREGLEIIITLDCRHGHNEMTLKTEADGPEYRIPGLPEGQSWRIHVNMVGEGDQVRLVDVKTLND